MVINVFEADIEGKRKLELPFLKESIKLKPIKV